jgi:RHS repeat-associated protein
LKSLRDSEIDRKTGPTAIVPTGANYYVYDLQGQLIGEYNATNKVISETVYLGNTPVALIKQTIAGTTTTTTANYIYADQIDTPRVITRASDNKMVWRWDQADPFGLTPASENPQALGVFASNARFPGQVYDKETNLHYNWHRDFDPQLGRYIQSDPIGLAGGINTFAYVEGNPLVYVDPNGLEWFRPITDQSSTYYVGRDGHPLVRTGGLVSKAIEHCVPAGRTFGKLHDAKVDELTAIGISDKDANIPTMLPMF